MRKSVCSIAVVALMTLSGLAPAAAQVSATDIVVRIEQLESQLRLLTGQIEQLQFRNQQLEQQLRRMQEDTDFRLQELGAKPGSAAPRQAQTPVQQPAAPSAAAPQRPATAPLDQGPSPIRPLVHGRRSDVFDPAANPNAPGAPRPLGGLPAGQTSAAAPPPIVQEEPVGARGGREPGSPLDLSTLAGSGQAQLPSGGLAPPTPGPLPPPPQRNPSATGAQTAAVAPPSQSPRDYFDLGRGYVERKDYALAEQTFRDFLNRYPNDGRAAEAQYWLGESLFQRQKYRDAAENFLNVSTRYETSAKAPDALYRLGQSLAALGEKNAACATFGEIARKYPRASLGIRQGVAREQKRAGC